MKKQVLWTLFFSINFTFSLFSVKNKTDLYGSPLNKKNNAIFGLTGNYYKVEGNTLLLNPQKRKKKKNPTTQGFYEREIKKGNSLKALQINPAMFQHSSDSERSVNNKKEEPLPNIPW